MDLVHDLGLWRTDPKVLELAHLGATRSLELQRLLVAIGCDCTCRITHLTPLHARYLPKLTGYLV